MSESTEEQHSEASPQPTPGPWHVVHGLYPDGEVEVQGGGANLTGPIASLENANLIAAAPDLLAALKEAEGFILECDKTTIAAAENFKTLPAIRAAIAKAEGRQPVTPTASDTCTLRDPARPGRQLCDQRSSYFRTDGLCFFHGKVADGLTGSSPLGTSPGLRGGVKKFPGGNAWDALFDGEVHPVPPNVGDSFRRSACKAATQRSLQFRSWTENGQVYLQAQPRQAVAS